MSECGALIQHPRHFFDQGTSDAFEHAYLTFRFAYNELARSALERGLPRFHMRPKVHVLEHIVMEFRGKNPRYFTNYLGEDAVRRTKALAAKAPARFLSHHVLFRYVISKCLELR